MSKERREIGYEKSRELAGENEKEILLGFDKYFNSYKIKKEVRTVKKWLSAIAILVAMCLVVIVVQQNKISELRGGRPIDLSQAPLPSSGKTITAEEFKKEIFNVFTGGWRGFERERTVPTKEDVESFLDFAKPGITIETEKVLVLYASMLSINAWRESTIGLFLDDGDRCIAIFTTEGWYMIDPQLRLSELPSFYPCGLDVAL